VQRSIQHNIERYPWFQAASSIMAWLPIFFLYFSQYVSLSEVIQLGAIYYFCVCLFEVPSGYFSDRVGRRITLVISSFAFISAYLAFIFASDFEGLLIGQTLLALGMAMMSGTDTALLYDSLLNLKQQDNYADHEAKGQQYGFAALAISCLLGGLLGLVNLQLAYGLSLMGAGWMLLLALQFVEPASIETKLNAPYSFSATLITCVKHLRTPVLAWIFGVMVLMYCMEHIAYEFYQPYIKLLNIQWLQQESSPLISGIIIAISMFGGTLGAAYSVRLSDRFGVKTLLMLAMSAQLIIISSLAFVLSSLLIFTVIFRNFPMALTHAPVNATIAPFISSDIRATYLSLQSLSARLVFSIGLIGLSKLIPTTQTLDWLSLSTLLQVALTTGGLGLLICLFSMSLIKKPSA
jgi:MFS family permease